MSDKYLKQIAKELRLIRKEKELQNNLLMQDMGMIPSNITLDDETVTESKDKPDIAKQLNEMFKRWDSISTLNGLEKEKQS